MMFLSKSGQLANENKSSWCLQTRRRSVCFSGIVVHYFIYAENEQICPNIERHKHLDFQEITTESDSAAKWEYLQV